MNRKDAHIHFALQQSSQTNDFDLIRIKPNTFPEIAIENIDLSISLFNRVFPTPIYLNAMTGGSDQAKVLNERFARLAHHFQLPMATGSVSAALKDASLASTFTIIRQHYPDGFIIANLGAGQSVDHAKRAVALLQANAFQIHVNAVQEAIMPEGEKDYRGWLKGIQDLQTNLPVPLIIKEVGFGMDHRALQQLKQIGVTYVDLAGKGGTNFAVIENQRRSEPFHSLNGWGLSTVESLLEAQHVSGIHYFASGGIRNPLDVIKALALGAKAVGLSGYFLHLVSQHAHEESVAIFSQFLLELKTIMLVLGVSTIASLTTIPLIYEQTLMNYRQQIK